MKKLLFGIFAHPDDEAFGPSATLYRESHSDTDVHLVVATDGEAGTNCDDCEDLASLRAREWQESGKRIGIKSGVALHYPDGELSNKYYLEIAKKIIVHIKKTVQTYDEPILLEIMTFDHNGITGHLDHIAISYITTYVYLKLRDQKLPNVTLGKLKYYCLPSSVAPEPDTHWIYMACGRSPEELDEVVDYTELVDTKLHIMKAHYSQRQDMEKVLLSLENAGKPDCNCDHFRYFKD